MKTALTATTAALLLTLAVPSGQARVKCTNGKIRTKSGCVTAHKFYDGKYVFQKLFTATVSGGGKKVVFRYPFGTSTTCATPKTVTSAKVKVGKIDSGGFSGTFEPNSLLRANGTAAFDVKLKISAGDPDSTDPCESRVITVNRTLLK